MGNRRNVLIAGLIVLINLVSVSCVVENGDEAYQRIEFKNDSPYALEVSLPQGIMDESNARQFSLAPGDVVGYTSNSPLYNGPNRTDCSDARCDVKEIIVAMPDSAYSVRFLLDSCGAYGASSKKEYFNPCCPNARPNVSSDTKDLIAFRYTFIDSILVIARDYELY
ncbi:MAG: hypothetical protein NXI09_00585 [Bacteroidetes bacterium]|nr:hypothetical protein [Bacteroidota bacterium]